MKKSFFLIFSLVLSTTQLTGCLESVKGCTSDSQCNGERVCMDGLCGEATPNNHANNGDENNDNNGDNNGYLNNGNNNWNNGDNNWNNGDNNENNENNLAFECVEGGQDCDDDLVCSGQDGMGYCKQPDMTCVADIDRREFGCFVDVVCEDEDFFFGYCETLSDGTLECLCTGNESETVFQSEASCNKNTLAEAFNTHCGSRIPPK